MRRVLVGLLVALAACHGESVSAPEKPDLSCANAITPPIFHTVRGVDTTAWANRYAVPHKWADTLHITGSGPAFDLIATHGGNCTLLSDSLIIYHTDSRVIP